MSSFSGTTLNNGQNSDAGLQLAPVGNDGPDHALLTKTFETTVANLQGFTDQCQENYNTRYALWSGQSADGKKHAREGSKIDPTPWDGASDLQVFLTDEAIISKVAMLWIAFLRAGITATPVEGNDIKRAKSVSSFMRWLVQTQIPEVGREVELLANYIQEMGVGAIGVFWEETQEKILQNVTLEQLQAQFPTIDVQALIYTDDTIDDAVAIFTEIYGCTAGKARKMIKELRAKQETSVPTLGRKKSFPVLRAFNLNQNLFIPNYTTDAENASAMFRVEYYTAEQLRGFVNTAGWDDAWVEAAIKTCKGTQITLTNNEYNQPISRSFMYQQQNFTDLIGVVYAYQRLSDEDGYTGLYLTIFNPRLAPDGEQDGYAKFGLLGYADGAYPFVIFRREHLSRKLHDTRGIPEPGKPLQQQIKVHKDSLIDAASLAICPPMMYPQGRPPLRWGAGARIAERRPGEYHFADRPAYDPSTEKSEANLKADFNQYLGFVSAETDPTFAGYKNQKEAESFMAGFSKVFSKVWSRYKQYGSEAVYFRVVGLKQADPVEFHKGEDNEEFDFRLTFDIQSMNPEVQQQKLKSLAEVAGMFDKYGQIDYGEVIQLAVQTIDPNWAELVVLPKDTGAQKTVNETHSMLAQVFAGVDRDIDLNAPPDLVMQTIQNYGQQPDVQQRYAQDPSFKARLDKIVKQTGQQIVQKKNAKVGVYGA